jgi:hypothetical protein
MSKKSSTDSLPSCFDVLLRSLSTVAALWIGREVFKNARPAAPHQDVDPVSGSAQGEVKKKAPIMTLRTVKTIREVSVP